MNGDSDQKEELYMQISPHLVEAGKRTVAEMAVGIEPVQIIGYEQMFVAESDNKDLKKIHFFSSDDRRFCIGVKRT